MFLNIIYFCEGKAELLSAISPVFSVTWSFRNHLVLISLFSAQETFLIIINVENTCLYTVEDKMISPPMKFKLFFRYFPSDV